MHTLRIVGVPEHFNLPWQLALEQDAFLIAGVKVEWQYNKAGTGSMVNALRNDEVDLALVLTEGIVSAIVNGLEAKIVKQFITSPLIWGIHTGPTSGIASAMHCQNCKIAISRFGSGSHLMAMVDAEANGRKVTEENFTVVGDIDGALKSLNSNEAQLFYWEKFTTKPWVDNGSLKRIGEFLTPWPCFVVAASNKAIQEKKEAIAVVLEIISKVSMEFVSSPNAVQWLIERFEMKPEDATSWFYSTDWSYDHSISAKMLQNVMHALQKVGAIKAPIHADLLCSKDLILK